MTLEKDDFAKFLAEYQTSRCLFCKKVCRLAISCKKSNAMFDYRTLRCLFCKKNLPSNPFLNSRKFETRGCQWNGFNIFSRIRGIVEQGLGHLFIDSSSSRFFKKTDLEQYFFGDLLFEVLIVCSVNTSQWSSSCCQYIMLKIKT